MKFLLILVLFSPAAFAAKAETKNSECVDARQMKVEGKDQKFCWSERLDAWITPACVNDKVPCGAIQLLEAAKKYPEKLSSEELSGGKNPGSVLCAKIGGEVMFAQLPSGSQASFCQGADKSMIDCNALLISK